MKKYHCVKNNQLIYSDNNLIKNSEELKLIVNFNQTFLNSFSLLNRLQRKGIHNVKCIKNLLIIVIKGRILFYNNKELKKVFTINRGSRPLRQGIEILDENLYFGDYWGNPNRLPVNIYKINIKTFEKEIFYSFSQTRHIHFIQKDEQDTNSLFIGTGDSDHESGIYKLNTKTKELSIIAKGNQKFRAVSILQVNNKLFWGSDDPNGQNYIYSIDRDTNELSRIYKIEGPAYYSTINKNGEMFIATTIEDRKKHKAIIYSSSDDGKNWSIYKEFKKDIWHTKYFGYGIIEFIDGQKEYDKLIYNLNGLKEINE